METRLNKLKSITNQLLVDCFRDCLLTMPLLSILLQMVVGCFLTLLEACLLIIQELDCLGQSQLLGCLGILELLPINQKLVDCSVAHHHQVLAVSSTSKQAVCHQSKTQGHHYSAQDSIKMTTTTQGTVHNLRQPKIFRQTQQRVQ